MGSTTTTARRRRTFGALILTGTLALAACGGDDEDAASSEDAAVDDTSAVGSLDEPTDALEIGDAGATGGEEGDGDDRDVVDGVGSIESSDAGFDLGAVGRDVIIEMRVVMSSDDIQRTVASITADASALGGGIASSDVDFGAADDPQAGHAILVVKVPPTAVDRLLSGLDDAGTVQSIDQSAQDVTEQLVDLGVRIANARRSVANVREFMDRTENLSELVTLEGELTRRQTELERLEAQQRNLGDRVALSTITIEVVPAASVPEPVDDDPDTIGDAFQRGWDAFTSLLFAIGYLLAVTLPFLLVGLGVAAAVWAVTRFRRIGATGPADSDPEPPSESTDPHGPSGSPEPGVDEAVNDESVEQGELATPVG